MFSENQRACSVGGIGEMPPQGRNLTARFDRQYGLSGAFSVSVGAKSFLEKY
jgi:hypothetical protein